MGFADLAITVFAALLIGGLIGAIGIGGVLLTPWLTHVIGLPVRDAIVISSFAFIGTGVAALIISLRSMGGAPPVNWPLVVATAPGALAGAWALAIIPGELALALLAVLTIGIGLKSLLGREPRARRPASSSDRDPGVPVGAFTGVGSALTGTGGPMVMMPILLWAARRARLPLPLLFVCLGVLPMLLRWYGREAALGAGFGLPYTATHLRMEGLVLAFWASRWSVVGGERWIKLRDAARPLLLALVPATVWAFAWSPASRYVLSGTLIAVSFATMLLAGVGRVRFGRINGLVHSVAIRSYSIYLTHALGIHVARQASLRIDGGSAVSYLAIVSALIISAGWMFHSVVEQPVLRLRERFAPNRTERAESAQVALSSLRSP